MNDLDAQTVRIRASNQAAFTTFTEVAFTVPSNPSAWGTSLVDGIPFRTAEGAVGIPFTAMSGLYWRVFIDAMGAVVLITDFGALEVSLTVT